MDSHDLFKTSRVLIMNPYAINESLFIEILLRRLQQGSLIVAIMEVPKNEGYKSRDIANHASVIYSQNGEVYFDGLKVDFDFLMNSLYFSRITTLIAFSFNGAV